MNERTNERTNENLDMYYFRYVLSRTIISLEMYSEPSLLSVPLMVGTDAQRNKAACLCRLTAILHFLANRGSYYLYLLKIPVRTYVRSNV